MHDFYGDFAIGQIAVCFRNPLVADRHQYHAQPDLVLLHVAVDIDSTCHTDDFIRHCHFRGIGEKLP